MISAPLRRTLSYALKVFIVLVPVYYFVYGFIGTTPEPAQRLQTSAVYAFIVTLFLGTVHYFFRSKRMEDAGADPD